MSIKRELWRESFRDSLPAWPCPNCGGGRLRTVRNSLLQRANAKVWEAREYHDFEPDWDAGAFTCLMECDRCHEGVAVAGSYTVVMDEIYSSSEPHLRIDPVLSPKMVTPAPPVIELPENIPDVLRTYLRESFELFWSDAEACANRVRTCVEVLLDRLKIPRTTVRGKVGTRRRVRIKLHDRIDELRTNRPRLAATLEAIKWIGNAGSHSSVLSRDDVLDGYDLMEHAIDQIGGRRDKRLDALARHINRRKRPRTPNRKGR